MKIALKSPWVYIARSSGFKCFSSPGKPEKKEKRKIKKGRVRKEWDKKSRGLYLANGNYPQVALGLYCSQFWFYVPFWRNIYLLRHCAAVFAESKYTPLTPELGLFNQGHPRAALSAGLLTARLPHPPEEGAAQGCSAGQLTARLLHLPDEALPLLL